MQSHKLLLHHLKPILFQKELLNFNKNKKMDNSENSSSNSKNSIWPIAFINE